MSYHYSGPNIGFHMGNRSWTALAAGLHRSNAFPKVGDASKSILIMEVHPSVSFSPSAATVATPFATDALYQIKIDTDGDTVANIVYSVRLATVDDGKQTATLTRLEGPLAGTGDDGAVIVAGAPLSTGREAAVTDAGGYRFFAGWRSDPFFVDAVGAANNLQLIGQDYFADKNVCSVAPEVPDAELKSRNPCLWACTLDRRLGSWIQTDRGAKLSIQSVPVAV